MPDYTPEQKAAFTAWWKLKNELDSVKEREMQARILCTNLFFASPEQGTNSAVLAPGYVLKATFGVNISLPGNDEVDLAVDEIKAVGDYGEFIAADIFKWKPSLSVTTYNKVKNNAKFTDDEIANQAKAIKSIVERVITIKPATVALEYVQPKAK